LFRLILAVLVPKKQKLDYSETSSPGPFYLERCIDSIEEPSETKEQKQELTETCLLNRFSLENCMDSIGEPSHFSKEKQVSTPEDVTESPNPLPSVVVTPPQSRQHSLPSFMIPELGHCKVHTQYLKSLEALSNLANACEIEQETAPPAPVIPPLSQDEIKQNYKSFLEQKVRASRKRSGSGSMEDEKQEREAFERVFLEGCDSPGTPGWDIEGGVEISEDSDATVLNGKKGSK
jgi:hypothetical protein